VPKADETFLQKQVNKLFTRSFRIVFKTREILLLFHKMDPEKVQQIISETERAAQKVLTTKDELSALDFRRQKTREALRALKNEISANKNSPEKKMWLSLGNLFVKTETSKAHNLLQKGVKGI